MAETNNIFDFPQFGFSSDEWTKIKRQVEEYEAECESAKYVLKRERLMQVYKALGMIREVVNRHFPDDETVVELTHTENDLRCWQIRIRTINFGVPQAKIEMFKNAIKYASEFECAITDEDMIEVVIGFNDCATKYVMR